MFGTHEREQVHGESSQEHGFKIIRTDSLVGHAPSLSLDRYVAPLLE
jgi:hypothetical protein